jgi:hypothetical protein
MNNDDELPDRQTLAIVDKHYEEIVHAWQQHFGA